MTTARISFLCLLLCTAGLGLAHWGLAPPGAVQASACVCSRDFGLGAPPGIINGWGEGPDCRTAKYACRDAAEDKADVEVCDDGVCSVGSLFTGGCSPSSQTIGWVATECSLQFWCLSCIPGCGPSDEDSGPDPAIP